MWVALGACTVLTKLKNSSLNSVGPSWFIGLVRKRESSLGKNESSFMEWLNDRASLSMILTVGMMIG